MSGIFTLPLSNKLLKFVHIVESQPAGTKIIVHCEGGIGRTGTFASAYWILRGLNVSEAIAHVRKERPGAVETPEQHAVLEEFAKRISI